MIEPEVADTPQTPEVVPADPLPRNRIEHWGDLELVVEYDAGDLRAFPDGYPPMPMFCSYGYIKESPSMERGDEMDFFLAENPIPQLTIIAMLEEGIFQEEKVFLGFKPTDAQECFDKHYGSAKRSYSYVMTTPEFQKMLALRKTEGLRNSMAESYQEQLSADPMTLTQDLEMEAEPLKKSRFRSEGTRSLSLDQKVLWKSLRESEIVAGSGGSTYATFDAESGLFPASELARVCKVYGVQGKGPDEGHREGEPFRVRHCSYEEYCMLELLAAGIPATELHKSILRSPDDTMEKQIELLRGWLVLPKI